MAKCPAMRHAWCGKEESENGPASVPKPRGIDRPQTCVIDRIAIVSRVPRAAIDSAEEFQLLRVPRHHAQLTEVPFRQFFTRFDRNSASVDWVSYSLSRSDCRGRMISIFNPLGAAFSARIVPPCIRMTRSAIARPSPVPPDCRSRAVATR